MIGLRRLRAPSRIAHALLVGILAGSSFGLGAVPALAAQGSVQVDAPGTVEMGQAIRVVLTARGVSDMAGFEAGLRFDQQAAEFGGAAQSQAILRQLGRDSQLMTAESNSGASFGMVSCSESDCSSKARPTQRRGASGNVVLARVSIIPQREGVLEIALDHVLVVDSDGNPIAAAGGQVLRVTVGKGGPSFSAPAGSGWNPNATRAKPGPFDVTGEGIVNSGDLLAEALAWRNAHEGQGACGSAVAPALDVNHNGCLDVGDVQMVAARMDPTVKVRTSQPSPVTPGPGQPAPAASSGPLTFTVNSTTDDQDSNKGDGVCRTRRGVCTLRAAIQETNLHDGPDTIAFNISGSGVHTIQLTDQLPGLWDYKTTIDGYTQPGARPNTDPKVSNAVIKIQVRGGGINNFSAFGIGSSYNVIRGLAIYNAHVGVDLYGSGAHHNSIVGNFIGFDVTGKGGATSVSRNNGVDLASGASYNIIGTPALADRNVISGASWVGVSTYDTPTVGNIVQNNLVGLNPSGTAAIPNLVHGLDVNYGSAENIFGGVGPNEYNVVSGNGDDGIQISHNIDTPPERNVVIGNWVGLDPNGQPKSYAANRGWGIRLEDNPRDTIVTDNIVGNNRFGGIDVEGENANGNVVKNNKIGFAVDGSAAGNSGDGVRILYSAVNNVIGPNNVIANNTTGIHALNGRAYHNTFTRNSIYNNGSGNGIQLDNGSNYDIVPPTIKQATTRVVSGTTCANCTVEVFLASKPAGQAGQGKTFVGSQPADGDGAFNVEVSGVTAGAAVTATTTRPTGDTSIFSINVAVTGATVQPAIAADAFGRTQQGGWGSADTGGAYSLAGSAADYSVSGGTGIHTVRAGAELDSWLQSTAARDLDATLRFSVDRAATGNGQQVSLIARRTSGGNMEHARVMISPSGALALQAYSLSDWRETALGSQQVVPGLTFSPGASYRLRVQVTGANPTTIRMKLWPDGQPEPADWQYTATDTAAVNQGSGALGIRSYVSSAASNGPVVMAYDDLLVTAP